ncbi:hypothetical protein [Falsiroseomonas oryziterrae]|uniref:hypothetical protein n=1 Tax=Falsiroseomonas oryziterrae TaxID=2911368 RepID=UPI001F466FEC|nr:hypothetical protein [Roseomonas sp. NPKOSM-4]
MRAAGLALAAMLAACAAPRPQPGEEIRAEVLRIHRAADLERDAAASPPAERAHLESSGFADAVREGRAVRVRCAAGRDEVLITDAIAPPGMALAPSTLVRLAWGSEVPPVPNRVLGPLDHPRIRQGTLGRPHIGTFQLVPWSATPVLAPLEPWQEAEYAPVRGYLLLRCRPRS